MTGGDAIPPAKKCLGTQDRGCADGLYSSHGTGALAGAFLGVHVSSAGGGIHHFAVEQSTIAQATAQSDFYKETP